MIDIESIGSRVKLHRLANNISQEKLAELAQVSRVHISYLERGERIPSILSGLKELEAAGYLERHRYRSDRGRLGDSEYVIYEVPHHLRLKTNSPNPDFPDLENPALEKPAQEKPTLEKPTQENPPQINKEVISKDKKIIDQQIERESTSPRHRYGLYQNVLLSDTDLQFLREQFPKDYTARIDRLSEYMASSGRTYKNHLATIRRWARKDTQQNNAYWHGMYTYDGNDSL